MHFVLVCPTDESVVYGRTDAFDRNATFLTLERVRSLGHSYEVIDGGSLSDNDRQRLYTVWETQAVMTGNGKNYRVRNVFGSNRHGGGPLFGKQVPALVVFEHSFDGAMFPPEVIADIQEIMSRPFARDLYPHKLRHDGEVSIRQFLQTLLDGKTE